MIKTRPEATALIVELPTLLDGAFGEHFESASKEWLVHPFDGFAFDFKNVISVRSSSSCSLLGFARMARTGGTSESLA